MVYPHQPVDCLDPLLRQSSSHWEGNGDRGGSRNFGSLSCLRQSHLPPLPPSLLPQALSFLLSACLSSSALDKTFQSYWKKGWSIFPIIAVLLSIVFPFVLTILLLLLSDVSRQCRESVMSWIALGSLFIKLYISKDPGLLASDLPDNDGDGQRHDERPGYGAERPDELAEAGHRDDVAVANLRPLYLFNDYFRRHSGLRRHENQFLCQLQP